MIGLLVVDFEFLGLLNVLQGWQSDAPVAGERPAYDRPSSRIPGYHDDGHIRQVRRRARDKDRRAEEARRKR